MIIFLLQFLKQFSIDHLPESIVLILQLFHSFRIIDNIRNRHTIPFQLEEIFKIGNFLLQITHFRILIVNFVDDFSFDLLCSFEKFQSIYRFLKTWGFRGYRGDNCRLGISTNGILQKSG